jgi:hypothetical protein
MFPAWCGHRRLREIGTRDLGHEEIAFLQGTRFQLRLRRSMECDLRNSGGARNSNSPRTYGPDRKHGFHIGSGLSRRKGIAGEKRAFHGALCLQRYLRDGDTDQSQKYIYKRTYSVLNSTIYVALSVQLCSTLRRSLKLQTLARSSSVARSFEREREKTYTRSRGYNHCDSLRKVN